MVNSVVLGAWPILENREKHIRAGRFHCNKMHNVYRTDMIEFHSKSNSNFGTTKLKKKK